MKEYRLVPDPLTSIFTSRFFIIVTIGFLLFSLINFQSEMTVLLLILMGILVSTNLWSLFAVSNMEIHFKIDKHRVFPDEEIRVDVRAANKKLLPVWLKVSLGFARSCFLSKSPASHSNFLLWFQESSFTWNLTSLKRGCFNIGRPEIVISDLFGFFPRQHIRKDTQDVIVFQVSVHSQLQTKNFSGFQGPKVLSWTRSTS